MTGSDASDEPAEPASGHADTLQPAARGARSDLLALATRALAAGQDAPDDHTLLALIRPAVLPALGELAALLALGEDGTVHLAGVAATEASLGQRLSAHTGPPTEAADVARLIAEGRPRVVPGVQPFGPAAGIQAALAAPIGSGAGHDALLFVGTAAPGRQYDAADLVTLEVLAGLLTASRTVRELTRREAAIRQQLEAGAQAGRLLAHRLNNDLTMPVGVVELLLDRGTAGSELQEMLEAASHDLAAMEQHIREFHDEMRAIGGGGGAPQATATDPGSPPR
jgi:hypothetical protein